MVITFIFYFSYFNKMLLCVERETIVLYCSFLLIFKGELSHSIS